MKVFISADIEGVTGVTTDVYKRQECEVILPVLRASADSMQLGIVHFHEINEDEGL